MMNIMNECHFDVEEEEIIDFIQSQNLGKKELGKSLKPLDAQISYTDFLKIVSLNYNPSMEEELIGAFEVFPIFIQFKEQKMKFIKSIWTLNKNFTNTTLPTSKHKTSQNSTIFCLNPNKIHPH